MSGDKLVLTNQFGEVSENIVDPVASDFLGDKVAANTIVSNLTASSAFPLGNTYADVSAKLLPTQLLTGFTAGAGTVAPADTVLEAIQKLAGNTQNLEVTANLLTGLAAGANTPIAATDTILEALANLQAQIDALP